MDMTPQQASLLGVIICPALCRTAVKGELLHRNPLLLLGRGSCVCQQGIRQMAIVGTEAMNSLNLLLTNHLAFSKLRPTAS